MRVLFAVVAEALVDEVLPGAVSRVGGIGQRADRPVDLGGLAVALVEARERGLCSRVLGNGLEDVDERCTAVADVVTEAAEVACDEVDKL